MAKSVCGAAHHIEIFQSYNMYVYRFRLTSIFVNFNLLNSRDRWMARWLASDDSGLSLSAPRILFICNSGNEAMANSVAI